MRKRNFRRSFAVLTAFAIFFSLVFLINNEPITKKTVFAAGAFSDKDVTVDFEGYTTSPDDEINPFSSTKASFTQDGEITVGYESIDKEVLILLDSCYKATKTKPEILSVLEKCLFSLDTLTIQGNITKIEGDVFTRNELIVKSGSEQVEILENSNIEYDTFKRFEDDPSEYTLEDVSDFFDVPEDSGKVKIITDKKKAEVDELINDDENNYVALFNYIQQKVDRLPEAADAKFLFNDDTVEDYFENDVCDYDGTGVKIFRTAPGVGSNDFTKSLYNYEINGANFILRSSMYFDGNLKISVPNIHQELLPGTEVVFIYATGDIALQGNTGAMNESDTFVLMSRYGNIDFDPRDTQVNAILFAPEGDVNIKGQGVNFKGCFAGKNVNSFASNSTFDGLSGETQQAIEDEIKDTKGFQSVISSISHIPESFDANTKVGVVQYSDCAYLNDNDVMSAWKFYDMNPASNEKDALKNYVKSLVADTETERSNLGDAMRRALGIFESDKSSDETEKFMLIFTGMNPNAYSVSEDSYITDVNEVVNKNSSKIEDDGKQLLKSSNGYVEEMVNAINEYNRSNDADIHIIFVDLSLFRQDSNVDDDGIPTKIIPPLTELAASLGIEPQAPSGDNVYYMPTKQEVESADSDQFIIKKLAEYTNEFDTKLAVEDLTINSAIFKLSLPQTLKPISMFVKDIDGTEFDDIVLSTITAEEGFYNVEYSIGNIDISDFAKLKTTDGGETYTLEAGEITIDLYVNNDDGSLNGPELLIEKPIESKDPTITYEFKDRNGNTYNYDVLFENIKFNVVYRKDIN